MVPLGHPASCHMSVRSLAPQPCYSVLPAPRRRHSNWEAHSLSKQRHWVQLSLVNDPSVTLPGRTIGAVTRSKVWKAEIRKHSLEG